MEEELLTEPSMRDRIISIQNDPSLSVEEKSAALGALSRPPAPLTDSPPLSGAVGQAISPVPPAPMPSQPLMSGAVGQAISGAAPLAKEPPHSITKTTVVEEPTDDLGVSETPSALMPTKKWYPDHAQGEARGTRFISGMDTSGRLFQDPVNTPPAEAFYRMAQAYEAETGEKLIITSGQRTIEEQRALQPNWPEEKLARGQHVKGKAYDIHMVPDAADGVVVKGGKEWKTGHRETPEYKWLEKNAAKFGFTNTAPTHEPSGRKEWWHWEFTGLPETDNQAAIDAAQGSPWPPVGSAKPGQSSPANPLAAGSPAPSAGIPLTPTGVVQHVADQYNKSLEASGTVRGMVDVQEDIEATEQAMADSIGNAYGSAKDLLAKRNEADRALKNAQLEVVNKEITAEKYAQAQEEKALESRELLRQDARAAAIEKKKRIDEITNKLRSREISPWSIFGAYTDNPETGEREFSAGKALFTFTAGMALLANAALTMATSLRKKGKTTPFLVYDMLKSAIQIDTQAQVKDAQKDIDVIREDRKTYNEMYDEIQDEEVFRHHQQAGKIAVIRSGIKQHKLKADSVELRNSLDELDLRLKSDQDKAELAKETALQANTKRVAETSISAISAESQKRVQQARTVATGLSNIARDTARAVKAGKKKLSPSQRNNLTTARRWADEGRIRELETLWDRAGMNEGNFDEFMGGDLRQWMAKQVVKRWDTNGWPEWFKGIIGGSTTVKGGQYEDPVTKEIVFLADEKISRMSDLERIETIRTVYATQLAKTLGDVGAIAVQEGNRAMNSLPLADSGPLGYWKLMRFKQRMLLAGSEKYQLLSEEGKETLRGMALRFPDTVPGVKKQVAVYEAFLRHELDEEVYNISVVDSLRETPKDRLPTAEEKTRDKAFLTGEAPKMKKPKLTEGKDLTY